MRRPAGAVLPFALVAAAVLVVLVTMALDATARGARTAADREARLQAFYLAEAGRQRVLTTLAAEAAWNRDGVWFPLGAGEYRVSASSDKLSHFHYRWTLTCQGRVGDVVETVTQQVEVRRKPPARVQELTVRPDTWRRE